MISDNVYEQIRNQVKVSSYLFLKTDPNELLLMTDVPNLHRPWRAMTALVDTDWYPASYPWHCVIELSPRGEADHDREGRADLPGDPGAADTYFAAGDVAGRRSMNSSPAGSNGSRPTEV